MDLLVTVDSGPMHWADALGVPLVAIFGATDPVRTGPYRQLDHVVAKDGLECRPCHARTCARGDLACLRTLDVETVFQAALKRL
jgi:heptosyltransferase I